MTTKRQQQLASITVSQQTRTRGVLQQQEHYIHYIDTKLPQKALNYHKETVKYHKEALNYHKTGTFLFCGNHFRALYSHRNKNLYLVLSLSERIVQGKQLSASSPSRTITYNTGFFTQFRWVLKRTFRNLMLNPQTSIAQVGTETESYP